MSDDGRRSLLALVNETLGAGHLAAGEILAGQFRVVRFLGGGGMGLVYEAQGPAGERFAVKTVNAAVDDETRARFEREAEAMSRLSHAGIVSVHAFGRTEDGAYFMVIDYVDGVPLSQVIARGAMPPAQAAGMLRQILFALNHAHAMGVVHRDLKPDNIMVEADGRVRMIDFGIAKLLDEVGAKLTRKGIVFGTPFYMAPEQATGRPVDGRADQYAAGVILFQMLTGRVPFWADDIATMLRKHAVEPPPTLAAATGGWAFAPALEAVVARALAKRADDRFPDMRAMALALDAAAQA